ncbi:MFS transporter [Egbenema bharatensis]|uniref:MFS transporter n=1 Tax=Egbenema bharatensis TaxID=3463334 RepID=UPI003A867746
MKSPLQSLKTWLPNLDRRIWILMAGRFLSQVGNGFVLFYAPIFFVNQVGLSAAAVGIGIGSQSVSGVFGRIIGGSMADSSRWGRRTTLLLSAAISAVADVFLVLSHDFTMFLIGNLLMGLGIGLYWPATEAVVADLSKLDQRNEAFALTRLADTLGMGFGVVWGGWLIATTGAYRALFVIDGISFVLFFGLIWAAIDETLDAEQSHRQMLKGWKTALSDRPLLIFAVVNILFTTYLAFINSALPLYFTNNVPVQANGSGFSSTVLSALFSWYIILSAICQLPVARFLNRFRYPKSLSLSAALWAGGFVLIWLTGTVSSGHLMWAVLGLAVMALATVAYTPAASALVAGLAPDAMRGVYLSINSLCWAAGYFIGPVIGGWAMDQPPRIADGFWLMAALSVGIAVLILRSLDRLLLRSER